MWRTAKPAHKSQTKASRKWGFFICPCAALCLDSPKTASAAVEKWRKLERARELTHTEKCAYGAAVGAWIRNLNAIKPSQGLNPKSNCASGQSSEFCAKKHRATLRAALEAQANADRRAWANGQNKNREGLTIREAYARVPKLGDRKPPKPHYVIRNGELVLR